MDSADFAGGQLEKREVTLAVVQNDACACAAGHLAAATGLEFHIMNGGTKRDFLKRKCIANLRFAAGTGAHLVTNAETDGREDVGLRLVRILDERDAACAVRIVFDRDDISHLAARLALEINDAVLLLVTAADVTGRKTAVVIAATGLGLGLDERFLRLRLCDLREIGENLEAVGRRERTESFESHIG